MKKLILLLIIPILGLLISSCSSNDNPVTPTNTKGNIYITSNPAGAQIWIDGVNSTQTTPDTVMNIEEGVRNVTLKLTDYNDTTFTLSVTAGQTSVVGPIALVLDISTTLFGPVKIYELFNTTPSQPSGLDLSSGHAWGVSSDSSGLVDIYYYSDQGGNTYLIQSADLYPLLNRVTKFYVGSGDNLFDGVDSPDRTSGNWTNSMSDHEPNYVFLYDHDGHYSKIQVVNWHSGGGPGDPSWVEIQWYYNNKYLDKRFK
jgi:hypothetical protein